MGRKPRQVVKGQHSTAHYFQLSKPNGLKQVKLRVKIDEYGSPLDVPLIYHGKKIKVLESQFDGGRITGGFENGSLVKVNHFMQDQQVRAVEIADEYFAKNKQLTGSQLSLLLSKPVPEKEEPIIQTKMLGGSPITVITVREDVDDQFAILDVPKEVHERTPDDFNKRYKNEHAWNKSNIFELLGYVRYGTEPDALNQEMPLISKPYKRLYKKLIFYRTTMKPHEQKSKFNAEWVHAFYRFIYEYGFERRLQKVVANPFKIDPVFVASDTADREGYNVNTFGEGVHKHMVGYIKALALKDLIDVDFTKKIQVAAFTKQYGGKRSSYGDSIYFVTPKEFLACLKNDVPDTKLNTVRHLFICQVMMGGMRVTNLNGKKVFEQLDHFNMIQFKQAKVHTLLSNVMLKPVRDILAVYKSNLPKLTEADYNEGLKTLFKYFVDNKIIEDRTITKSIKKLTKESEEEYKLYELVSSKFARSSYYVINGMLGVPIEEIAKRAGHATTDLAMKHYYNKAKENYTEQDRIELFEHFKK